MSTLDLELALLRAKIAEGEPRPKEFDPNQPRDPHTGEWTDMPGGSSVPMPQSAAEIRQHLNGTGHGQDIRGRVTRVQLAAIHDNTHAGTTGNKPDHVHTTPDERLRLAEDRKILYGGHAGTPEDPVPAGADLDRAVRIIADGGHVSLSQPDEVATLLDKLRGIVKDAEDKGEKAPTYDLCNVSVPGTNLFCKDDVKRPDGSTIARIQMPQLSTKTPVPGSIADKEPRNAKGEVDMSRQFGEFLASSGLETTETTIDASHLRASQSELDGGKVAGIAGAIASGKVDVNDPKGRIYVTEDNYVIDGHHRWAAAVSEFYRTGKPIDMPVTVVHTDIGRALTTANFWSDQMGIPPADVTKKAAHIDPWLYSVAARTPELLEVVQTLEKAGHGNEGNASSLIRWFNEGAGGAIAWGSPGDWAQCVAVASAHMTPEQAHGFCQNRHIEATGMSTAEHAHNDGKAFDQNQPRDNEGQWTDTGGGLSDAERDAAFEQREKSDEAFTSEDEEGRKKYQGPPHFDVPAPSWTAADPAEMKSLHDYLKKTNGVLYHGTSREGARDVLANGLQSDQDRGVDGLSEWELDDLSDPYSWDGVYLGKEDRASGFGDVLLAIDMKGMDDRVQQWVDGDALVYGSIPPDRISVVKGVPAKAFDPALHPRDNQGQFADVPGGGNPLAGPSGEGGAGRWTREPHERLTALKGAWADWQRAGVTEMSSAQITALGDPRLEVTGYAGSILGGDPVAARWQGDHIQITAEGWDNSEPDTREFLLAHETSHAAAADVLANNADKEAILAPFKDPFGNYDERVLVFPDERAVGARHREEMMSDVGATLLTYGRDVLQQRFENQQQYDIGATPPDPRLVRLYDAVAEALDRVGNPPPAHQPQKAFTERLHPRDDQGRFTDVPGRGMFGELGTGTPVPAASYLAEARRRREEGIAYAASQLDEDPAKLKAESDAHVRSIITGTTAAVRVHSEDLAKILSDGAIANRFQNAEAESTSALRQDATSWREDWENQAFGIPLDAPASERPVYGFLADDPATTPLKQGTPQGVALYGDLVLVMKSDVADRTTFTLGDSGALNATPYEPGITDPELMANAVPQPVNDPNSDAWDWAGDHTYDYIEIDPETGYHDTLTLTPKDLPSADETLNNGGYYEAQIHGGVKTSDIAEVVFTVDHSQIPWHTHEDELKARLDAMGIPWRNDFKTEMQPVTSPAPGGRIADYVWDPEKTTYKAFTETLHPRYPTGTPGGLGGQFMPEGGGDSGYSLGDWAVGRVSEKGGFHEGETVALRGGHYGTIARIDDSGAHVEVPNDVVLGFPEAPPGQEIRGHDTYIIPMTSAGPVELMDHAIVSDRTDDSGRTYAVTYPNAALEQLDAMYVHGLADRMARREEYLQVASQQLDDMIDRNHELEADTGLTNAWSGEMHLGVTVGSQRVNAAGTKDWECRISFDVGYMDRVRYLRVKPEEAAMIHAHELAHGLSSATVPDIYEPQVFGDRTYPTFSQSDAYRRDPGFEEGIVQGYVESKAQVEAFGPDVEAWTHEAPGSGAYDTWVSGLDEGLRISTDPHPGLHRVTTGERLDYFRSLLQTPLPERQDKINELIKDENYVLNLTGKGLGTKMGYQLTIVDRFPGGLYEPAQVQKSRSSSSVHDLIFTAESPEQAREILPKVSAYLATDPDDYLEVARDAEALVMLATSDMPDTGAKADFTPSLHPRDEHGRFTDTPGYHKTWKPEMTPAEGHAWAKAAGTKFPATVVHMTSKAAIEGIRGQGFNVHTEGDSTRVAHEEGAYFAMDTQSAAFYEYKGDQAVSAVVVLQHPLKMDWSHPEKLDRNTMYGESALGGSFREAALAAAGLNVDKRVYDANDNEYYASESPEDCTQALREAGYDGVILNAQSADTDPSVGGPQVIVFDKEQAVVIGTEEIPGAGAIRRDPGWERSPAEQQMWDEYYASLDTDHPLERPDEAAIARAFAKDFDPALHPRDDHGRFAHTPGGGLGAITAGEAPAGMTQATDLGNALETSARTLDEIGGPDAPRSSPALLSPIAAGAMKQKNVVEVGKALVERSKKDPALASQLDRLGMRVYSTTNAGVPNEEVTPYMHAWLGVKYGEHISTAEIGARELAAKMQDAWMGSASDTSEMSWGLQLAVADRLGVGTASESLHAASDDPLMEGVGYLSGGAAPAVGITSGSSFVSFEEAARQIADSPGVKAYVDEVYARTQDFLKNAGITAVAAYRGVKFEHGASDPFDNFRAANVETTLNPASSFSIEHTVAEEFAQTGGKGYILIATIPADRIFSLPTTGPGCLGEEEMLVAGGPSQVMAVPGYGTRPQGFEN